jgi:hypothetical protein
VQRRCLSGTFITTDRVAQLLIKHKKQRRICAGLQVVRYLPAQLQLAVAAAAAAASRSCNHALQQLPGMLWVTVIRTNACVRQCASNVWHCIFKPCQMISSRTCCCRSQPVHTRKGSAETYLLEPLIAKGSMPNTRAASCCGCHRDGCSAGENAVCTVIQPLAGQERLG